MARSIILEPILAFLETPYIEDKDTLERNVKLKYSRICMLDCLINHRELLLDSHLFYTSSGNYKNKFGIKTCLDWVNSRADLTAVYTDLGISEGMKFGIERAMQYGRSVEYRKLNRNLIRTFNLGLELIRQN